MADSGRTAAALSAVSRLSETDRELFGQCLDVLFTGTFVVRSIEAHGKLYRFLTANYPLFEGYFEPAGWGLKKDENLGVVSWQGPPKARMNLGKEESIALIILRILFEEKSGALTIHGERTILQQEFQDRYRIMAETPLKKTQLIGMLKRFQGLRLLKVIGEMGNPEAVILLYPSIPFALEGAAIDELHSKLDQYKSAGQEEE